MLDLEAQVGRDLLSLSRQGVDGLDEEGRRLVADGVDEVIDGNDEVAVVVEYVHPRGILAFLRAVVDLQDRGVVPSMRERDRTYEGLVGRGLEGHVEARAVVFEREADVAELRDIAAVRAARDVDRERRGLVRVERLRLGVDLDVVRPGDVDRFRVREIVDVGACHRDDGEDRDRDERERATGDHAVTSVDVARCLQGQAPQRIGGLARGASFLLRWTGR